MWSVFSIRLISGGSWILGQICMDPMLCVMVFLWRLLDTEQAWWRHQMETFSALLAICAGNSPVPGEFPTQRPVTRRFDVFFDLRLNTRLSKQSWGWWSRPLWRHLNGEIMPGNGHSVLQVMCPSVTMMRRQDINTHDINYVEYVSPSMRDGFNYLCHVSVEEHKM